MLAKHLVNDERLNDGRGDEPVAWIQIGDLPPKSNWSSLAKALDWRESLFLVDAVVDVCRDRYVWGLGQVLKLFWVGFLGVSYRWLVALSRHYPAKVVWGGWWRKLEARWGKQRLWSMGLKTLKICCSAFLLLPFHLHPFAFASCMMFLSSSLPGHILGGKAGNLHKSLRKGVVSKALWRGSGEAAVQV